MWGPACGLDLVDRSKPLNVEVISTSRLREHECRDKKIYSRGGDADLSG